jgi:hypothetical protein
MNQGLKTQLKFATQVERTPNRSTWIQKSGHQVFPRVVQLESMRGCKHLSIDSTDAPIGSAGRAPDKKQLWLFIKYIFSILWLIKTLGCDIRSAWVSTQVFDFPRHSGTHYFYNRSSYYGGGSTQGLDKLDPHVISTCTRRKKTPIDNRLILL